MYDALMQLALFTSKFLIVFLFIIAVLITFFALVAKSKGKTKGKLVVKKLNDRFAEMKETILVETLDKKAFKKYAKEKKAADEKPGPRKNVYVMNFQGDIKASAVTSMSEEINAILSVATPKDEVVLRLESPGGMVHGYGLASAQLMRFRAKHIPLTVTVDKVAASGGYMMACVGNKILSAPFAITGSIGVLIQMPNFNRYLKDKHIDFEQITAGEYKRTISLFGENTKEGKAKMQESIEDTHQLFKNFITTNRPQVDIEKVATGEHWFGEESLGLNLVDELKTSDDYLLELSSHANLFDVRFETSKPLLARLSGAAANIWHKLQAGMHG
jgi:serine protease SohB